MLVGSVLMNQRGDMVGGFAYVNAIDECYPPFVDGHGFLLRDGEFTRIDVPGSTGTDAFAINDDAVIVGHFTDKKGRMHGFRAVPKNLDAAETE